MGLMRSSRIWTSLVRRRRHLENSEKPLRLKNLQNPEKLENKEMTETPKISQKPENIKNIDKIQNP
jgi:hypothetical protein